MIYFVRHGFSLNNYGYKTGNRVPLNLKNDEYCPLEKKYGIPQVCETASYLRNCLKSRNVCYIVSPYYRARETLYYILGLQENASMNVVVDKNLREISHGLQCGLACKVDFFNDSSDSIFKFFEFPLSKQEALYQQFLQSDYKSKGHNSEYIEYKNGESIVDVKKRARAFLKSLKEIRDNGIYDDIVIVTHSTVINVLFSMMTGKKSLRMRNGSCLSLDDEYNYNLFEPKTRIPKNFNVSFKAYNSYSLLYEMQLLIDNLKDKVNFFTGDRKLLMPICEECQFILNIGDSWVVLPSNNKKENLIYISSFFGQDNIIYSKDGIRKYYVLSGSGVFYLRNICDKCFKAVEVNQVNNYIEIPSNTVFYYESCDSLRMLLKIPKGFGENMVVLGETPNLLKFREEKCVDQIKK